MQTVAIPRATLGFGANLLPEGGCSFRVWAPSVERMRLRLVGAGEHEMRSEAGGVFSVTLPARAGDRYFYLPDGGAAVPDPVSRFLPEGVHGPTEIVDPEAFEWRDQSWRGIQLRDAVIYELHVGTFSRQGWFEGVIERLQYLKRLGITLIELMPVAAFPGERNWGYDGVSPYAVQASYGGPQALKRLVDAAHDAGVGVLLDVVYNHVGHEGNYLRRFGSYFTERHKTPWGDAINFDGPGSEGVRRYVLDNALYWIREYHLDGLRLDAVQTIYDDSPKSILAEISEHVHSLAAELGREVLVIAETDQNDPGLLRQPREQGFGLDAGWSDDFHHAVHALLTGERKGYYQDFGGAQQIARALEEGFVFQGEHFKFWGRPRGGSPAGIPLERHVFCMQNHDQVGNRALGERLTQLVPLGARKLAAALLLLAPETLLLFMGEEFGEIAPFQFFTSYGDAELARAVSDGRRHEFKDFDWRDVPDPQAPETFLRSKLDWASASEQNETLSWYRDLLALRRKYIAGAERTCRAEFLSPGILRLQVPREDPRIEVLATFGGEPMRQTSAGFREVIRSEQDGYGIRVAVR